MGGYPLFDGVREDAPPSKQPPCQAGPARIKLLK